jgi:hypothetical protein
LHLIFCHVLGNNKQQIKLIHFSANIQALVKENGFSRFNLFYGRKKLSLRARNMDVEKAEAIIAAREKIVEGAVSMTV